MYYNKLEEEMNNTSNVLSLESIQNGWDELEKIHDRMDDRSKELSDKLTDGRYEVEPDYSGISLFFDGDEETWDILRSCDCHAQAIASIKKQIPPRYVYMRKPKHKKSCDRELKWKKELSE